MQDDEAFSRCEALAEFFDQLKQREMTLEQYCTATYVPPEQPVIGAANPYFTLCMHDPIYGSGA